MYITPAVEERRLLFYLPGSGGSVKRGEGIEGGGDGAVDAEGSTLVSFNLNPNLVRFKPCIRTTPGNSSPNFNPILVRFKHAERRT